MAELRYNQLLGDYVMIASHRQARPQMPKDYCPFCPGSGKVPDKYDVLAYNNDFPALSQNPPVPDDVDNGSMFKTKEAYGKCEVILFSPDHTTTLSELSIEHIERIVNLWSERVSELSKDRRIKYIMPFENKGEVVGVTMPHPHGQIYAYSWVPLRVRRKVDAALEYYNKTNKSLFESIYEEEVKDGRRIIFENENFLCYLPFASEYPYGINLLAKKNISSIVDFDNNTAKSLAQALKYATCTLDNLFDTRFPYMMCLYSAPVNHEEDMSKVWRFHIEFFPPMRSKDKQKFNASSETGAWAPCNPTAPEDTARELKAAYEKIKK